MISFYVTKAGKPFAVGKGKNDTFITVGTQADNDIVLKNIHSGARFLMVKIQTGILKVSCVASVRGLKVNKSSLSSGQDKLIPGSGKAPITIDDYIIYVKIGAPDESWPTFDDIKHSLGLQDVEKKQAPSRSPQTPTIPKVSGGETDFFKATGKKASDKLLEKKKEGKFGSLKKYGLKRERNVDIDTDKLFDDIDETDFYDANDVKDDAEDDSHPKSSKDELDLEKEQAAKAIGTKKLEEIQKDKTQDQSSIDDIPIDASVSASASGKQDDSPEEGAIDGFYDSEEEDADIINVKHKSARESSSEQATYDLDVGMSGSVDDEENEGELLEVEEVVEETEVGEFDIDEFEEIADNTTVVKNVRALISDISVTSVEAEPEEVEIPEPEVADSQPPRKMKKKPVKIMAQEPVQPAAAPAQKPVAVSQAPMTTPKPKKRVAQDIERKTTVRYYKQMVINKNFPLLVVFSKEEIEKIVQRDVAQIEGKEKVKVKKEKPLVKVVPQFPGCICVPERQEVDLTPESSEVTFWITPVAEGKLPGASVSIHYEGKIIQKIDCPTKVAKSTAAKVTAGAAIVSPIFFSAIESVGLDPKSQIQGGFPVVKQISNWLETQCTTMFGEPILSGMTLLGLLIGFVALIFAIIFFIRSRPKESDPVGDFLNFKFTNTLE